MLAEPYDAILFDLDGVLYLGSRPIRGAAEAVAALREAGKRIVFVTNNSSRTPREVAAHLERVGVQADPDDVETSSHATADLLTRNGVRSAFVMGEEGIRSALSQAGIELRDGEPDRADAVVIGFDRGATYAAIRTATLLVSRGADLVATNADASFPAADGTAWPGAGALLAAVETASGRRAEVVGKPNAPVLEAALRRAGGGRPLLVGDRLDTDIAGAGRLGWDSALVLTGIGTRDQIERADFPPTFVLDDLGGLVAADAD
jgi:phosphoglycolate/pyridoxal phosphate phosphatase family enzyme